MTITGVAEGRPRLAVVDLVRGGAIVAMVIYHAGFDLSSQRLIPTFVPGSTGWTILARLTAGTFLALVGVGLVLATRNGFDRAAFLRRLALIAGGAALVSLSTWWFDPHTWVFFGILHQIAVASVLALAFLRLPNLAVVLAAAFFLILPWVFVSPVFDAWPLLWVGLSAVKPVSVDYVPIFPWFGVVLGGIVLGRLLLSHGQALWGWRPKMAPARWLMTAGRWSLLIYLVHQPLLVGVVSLVAAVVPATGPVAKANVIGQCVSTCDPAIAAACAAQCGCMIDGMWGSDLMAFSSFDAMSTEQQARFDSLLRRCEDAAPMTPIPQN